MGRRMLTAAVVAVMLAAPAAAAPIRGQTLMPGVVYSKQVEFTMHGPVVLNVVSAPRPTGLYSMRALLSNGAAQGRERLTSMERSISDTATVVGVNGDFFNTKWGTPSGLLMRDGQLVTTPATNRSAAGFDASGALNVDRVSLAGTWKGTGQNWALTINAPPTSGSSTTLYTPAWGPTTPAEQGTTEVVLDPLPPATPNRILTAPAVQVAQSGNQPIPPRGAVLVARGAQAARLAAEAPTGTRVSIRLILTPPWTSIVDAVGGGPVLVRQGKAIFRSNELFAPVSLFQRTPRTAVGQTADGHVLLVAVDGSRPGYSTGMTNFELALALRRLGAVEACALGTGAYSALAFDGRLLSRPSGTAEGAIADALVLAYSGVYVPFLPDTTIASGTHVSLSYKVVRASTVAATLAAPDGTTTTLDAGSKPSGTYHVDWTATGVGHWTFAVSALDDLGRRSVASRTFTVGSSARRR